MRLARTGPDTPFQKIPDAARITGLSMYYLRKGCRDGTIPHRKSGTVYYVNVQRLLKEMEETP